MSYSILKPGRDDVHKLHRPLPVLWVWWEYAPTRLQPGHETPAAALGRIAPNNYRELLSSIDGPNSRYFIYTDGLVLYEHIDGGSVGYLVEEV